MCIRDRSNHLFAGHCIMINESDHVLARQSFVRQYKLGRTENLSLYIESSKCVGSIRWFMSMERYCGFCIILLRIAGKMLRHYWTFWCVVERCSTLSRLFLQLDMTLDLAATWCLTVLRDVERLFNEWCRSRLASWLAQRWVFLPWPRWSIL